MFIPVDCPHFCKLLFIPNNCPYFCKLYMQFVTQGSDFTIIQYNTWGKYESTALNTVLPRLEPSNYRMAELMISFKSLQRNLVFSDPSGKDF